MGVALSIPFDPQNFAILALALIVEAAIGYPAWLHRLIRHPVVWIGALIGALDAALNRDDDPSARRRLLGVAALVVVLLAAGLAAGALACALRPLSWGWTVEAVLAATLLAQRSLYDHVAAVAGALEGAGLAAGRAAVSRIVGRDPQSLDQAGVCRAAIESLAENFCDGVVAPAFWFALGGLPGLALYKAINTADSMIGHRTQRHEAFGWAAARLDDVVTWPAARLAAALLVAAAALRGSADAAAAFVAVRRDARRHRSPNAGWSEAAMAGALGLKLAGPRVYGGMRVEDAWMGGGRAAATVADIRAALALYLAAAAVLWLGIAAAALALG